MSNRRSCPCRVSSSPSPQGFLFLFSSIMDCLPHHTPCKRPCSPLFCEPNNRRVRFCPSLTTDDEKKKRKKKANRDRQRRFRERQCTHRNSETVGQNTSDSQDSCSPLSTYVPAHQLDAIAQFWTRLRSIEKNPETCSVCKECYHGIRMKGTQCERCFNEVRFIFFDNKRSFSLCCFNGTAERPSIRCG